MAAGPEGWAWDPATQRSEPFRHVVLPRFLSPWLSARLLEWLELNKEWGLRRIDDFYETHDLDLTRNELPASLAVLSGAGFRGEARGFIEQTFRVSLRERVDIMAQKMVAGQSIKVHTDYGPVGQSYRLLVQVNRGWRVDQGGLLMLLDTDVPRDVSDRHFYYLPVHGSALAFEISPVSFHAVSPIHKGTRYTVAYSFYASGEERSSRGPQHRMDM